MYISSRDRNIKILMLLSPSLLCSPHDRPMNPRDEVLRQERDFIREMAD